MDGGPSQPNIITDITRRYLASGEICPGPYSLKEESIRCADHRQPYTGAAFRLINFIGAVTEPEQERYRVCLETWLQRIAHKVAGTHWPLSSIIVDAWALRWQEAVARNLHTLAGVDIGWASVADGEEGKVILLQYLRLHAAPPS